MAIKIILGSASARKITSVQVVISEFLGKNFYLDGLETNSGVPETPWGIQTKMGAYNRAKAVATKAGIAIGLESGLVKRYGEVYEEVWCCIIQDGRRSFGYSSGIKVPDLVIDEMSKNEITHSDAMPLLRKKMNIVDKKDTWGDYSGGLLSRDLSFQEATRNALVQIVSVDSGMYNF